MKKVPKPGRDDPVEDEIFTEYEYNITSGEGVEDPNEEESRDADDGDKNEKRGI